MNNRLFTTFWHGRELNPIAYTSIKSFIDRGHRIQVFTYSDISNLPANVIQRNAEDILPVSVLNDFEGRIASFSDVFRYMFLYIEGGFWVDTDVVCIREDVPSDLVYMAYEVLDRSSIGSGALALPQHDNFAKILSNYAYDPGLVTPWEGGDSDHRLWLSRNCHSLKERRRHPSEYTFYGPRLLTNAARHYDYIKHAMPYTDLYTRGWSVWRRLFFDPDFTLDHADYATGWAIHCWGFLCNNESNAILKNGTGELSEMIRKNWKEIGG